MRNARDVIKEKLPEPYKTLALNNMDNLPLFFKEPYDGGTMELYKAINHMFNWKDSKEGYVFWETVMNSFNKGECDLSSLPVISEYGIEKPTPRPALHFEARTTLYVNGEEFDLEETEKELVNLIKQRDDLNETIRHRRKILRNLYKWAKDNNVGINLTLG